MRYAKFVPAAFAAASLLMLSSFAGAVSPTTGPTGTAAISGKLSDPAGKPAVNIRITLSPASTAATPAKPAPTADAPGGAGGKKKGGGGHSPIATATTGDDGTFKFDSLPAGEYVINARAKGIGSATVHITVKDGESKNVELTLAKKSGNAPAAK